MEEGEHTVKNFSLFEHSEFEKFRFSLKIIMVRKQDSRLYADPIIGYRDSVTRPFVLAERLAVRLKIRNPHVMSSSKRFLYRHKIGPNTPFPTVTQYKKNLLHFILQWITNFN